MAYALVCVHPFGNFQKGQVVTDPADVAKYQHEEDRMHHFVRITVADPVPAADPKVVMVEKLSAAQ